MHSTFTPTTPFVPSTSLRPAANVPRAQGARSNRHFYRKLRKIIGVVVSTSIWSALIIYPILAIAAGYFLDID